MTDRGGERAQVNYWRMHADLYAIASNAKPNPSHHIATLLAEEGRLLGVLTQNVGALIPLFFFGRRPERVTLCRWSVSEGRPEARAAH